MTTTLEPYEIRKLVVQIFHEFGERLTNLADLDETVLLDEGRSVARSYALGTLMAMWLVDVGILQFYDAQGNMLRTVNLSDDWQRRMAA
jgi:hypothetical protein